MSQLIVDEVKTNLTHLQPDTSAMYSAFLTLALLAVQCPAGRSEAAAGQPLKDEDIARDIHEFVLHLMDCHLSPALTLAVVKDGRVLLANGYGHTSINKSRAVTSETKFAIGSLTKAFTATLVAQWSFYPAFRVTDEIRSSQATLRDLLSHRMGLPSYFKALQMGFPLGMTRDKLMKRLVYMPSHHSFREKFIYNNYMYTLAAHVVEKMSGNRKWEELVRDTFLRPLNMSNSGFLSNISDFSHFALPCAVINSSIVDLSTELFKTVSPCDPAGSIYSNAEDMAKWMNFLLSNGRGADRRVVVDPEVILMTLEPGMISSLPFEELTRPKFPVSHVVQSYNMGWLTANYRGYRKVYHTGGVVTHFSRLWLYPDIKAGIYINVNGPREKNNKHSLLESLMYFVSDLLLNEEPWLKKDAVCQHIASLQQATSSEGPHTLPTTDSSIFDLQINSTELGNASVHNHSSSLQEFIGNYSHKCFGRIEITKDSLNSKLVFRFGRFGWMNLTHLSGLDFWGLYFGPLSYLNSGPDAGELIRFLRSPTGDISAVLYSMDAPNDFIQFDRTDMVGLDYDTNGGNGLLLPVFFLYFLVICCSLHRL
ncbi:unnamed protein product [Candidula unifasciata]|uniref:Beta-lactamase-related domain-containing protein n=1 Tax=Candidula unifasciata TaxID=100452 RepID=A0A8S3ZH83_9EUPU|nr:unnamed protein product [Candidula unifasciata]